MAGGPRNYTPMTLKRLFGLSGNQCSFEGCTNQMTNVHNSANSNICHIEAANDKGQRYNSDMTDQQRADYENLILLCPSCHVITNDVEVYNTSKLKKMKSEHETKIFSLIMQNNPTMLSLVIDTLSKLDKVEPKQLDQVRAFNITQKIEYNNLTINRPIVDEYKIYSGQVDLIYSELESHGSIKKDRVLDLIRDCYLRAKGKLLGDSSNIEDIRNNADQLFDEVQNLLSQKLLGSNMLEEEILYGLRLIAVDAFMRCKILEAPE